MYSSNVYALKSSAMHVVNLSEWVKKKNLRTFEKIKFVCECMENNIWYTYWESN